MAASDVRAGRAFVELAGKDNGLSKLLEKIQKRMDAIGKGLRTVGTGFLAAGTAITTPFIAAAAVFDSFGSELHDMAQRTGVSVEALSALKYAADLSSTSVEGLELGLKKMQKAIGDAANGSAEASKAIRDLGLSPAKLAQLKPEEQFSAVADAIDKIADPTKKAAAAMSIFGKSGTDLLPMLAGGSKALAEARKRAEELGLVMSTDDADAADAFGDALAEVASQLKTVTFQVGKAVATALMPYQKATQGALAAAIEFVKGHQGLVAAVAGVGAGLVVIGGTFIALGATISGIATTVGALSAVIGTLLTPVGLLAAGLTAGAVAFFKMTDTGRAALADLAAAFSTTASTAATAFYGIIDALKGGDFKLAGQIAVTYIQIAFEELKGYLAGLWDGIGNTLVAAMVRAVAKVKEVWLSFKDWFTRLTNYIGDSIVLAYLKADQKRLRQLAYVEAKNGNKAAANRALDAAGQRQKDIDYAEKQRDLGQTQPSEETNAAIAAIQKERDDTLAQLAKQEVNGASARTEELNARLKELTDTLKQKTVNSRVDRSLGDFFGFEGESDKATSRVDGALNDFFAPIENKATPYEIAAAVGDAIKQAYEAPSKGTFNPAAAGSLQSENGNLLNRIAKATEKTAKNTDNLKSSGSYTP